jgi:hypothetical protein
MPHRPQRRRFLSGILGTGGAVAAAARPSPAQAALRAPFLSVRDHGAAGDGIRLDTKAIQDAIDACARAGGGAVLFPAGRFVSGTLVLRDHVRLYLDAGSVLLGSTDLGHYPPHIPARRSYTDNYTEKSLIYAENVYQASIEGLGVIDGRGAAFQGPYKVRPYTIRMIGCRNITVSGVTLKDSPMWVQHYLDCEDLRIHGITVASKVNRNNDGIDIDCCRRVRISGCEISSGDDAIVLKSTADLPCLEVAITNCTINSDCNGLKLGTETNGGFQNIVIDNCAIRDTRLAGLTLQIVDGGLLDRVAVSNLVMKNVGAPIFLRLGNRARPFREGGPKPPMGAMRNISISNVVGTGGRPTGCGISGLPGHFIENVTLENIQLEFEGGGKPRDAPVPEHPDQYPEHNMFGVLPAYGLFCRHVRNLSLRNIRTTFRQPDGRPALICEDVEGLELAGAALDVDPETVASIRFSGVREAFVHGCRTPKPTRCFLQTTGAPSPGVSLIGNDLAKARRAVDPGPSAEAVFVSANRLPAGA